MKKKSIVILFLTSLFSLTGIAANSSEQPLDQVIAIVNDDIVTRSELNDALKTASLQLSQEDQQAQSTGKAFQKQVLEQIINRKIQLQLAQQVGIKLSDEALDKAIDKIAQSNHVSVQTLYNKINQEGMTTEHYRNEMRDQIILRKLQQQEVVNRINISPDEVDKFIRSKAWQDNESKEYKIEDILIPLSEAPSSEEIVSAKKHVENIIVKLKQGQSIKEISSTETAEKQLKSGNLGWRKLPEIPSAFAEEVIHMQPKEVSGPIQTSNGMHIIRLSDMRSLGKNKTAPDRKQVEELLLERKFDEAVQSWMSKLRHQAYIVNKLDV